MASDFPFEAERVRGGVEGVAAVLVDALKERPHLDLHVAATHSSVGAAYVERRPGVTLHWLPRPRRMATARMLLDGALRMAWVVLQVGPDVLHSQGPSGLPVAGLLTKRPLALTVHGLEVLEPRMHRTAAFAGPSGRLRRVLAELVLRAALARTSVLVSISPYVDEALGSRFPGVQRVSIENPVAPAFLALARRPSVAGGVVVSVGTLGERKNQLGLIQAFAPVAQRHADWRLVLVGDSPEREYRRQLDKVIDKLRLRDRVEIRGAATRSELVELYASADVLALSSLQETAPLVIAEAQAAGVAVVATDVGGIRWMIRDGQTGMVVPPDDEAAMTSALDALVSDPGRRDCMGRHARTDAAARFAPEHIADRTLALYQQMARHES
jgi:glycosyltransferase involved in cell wall biosynthesis